MTETGKKIELLKEIARRLNAADITWALGASMLLYLKGIASEFHDIDLMISTKDMEPVRKILTEMGELQPPHPDPNYRTQTFMEFVIDSIDVDVMAGFAVFRDGTLHDCSLRREQIVEWVTLENVRIPLQSPQLWRGYYELMGRGEKVDLIDRALSGR